MVRKQDLLNLIERLIERNGELIKQMCQIQQSAMNNQHEMPLTQLIPLLMTLLTHSNVTVTESEESVSKPEEKKP